MTGSMHGVACSLATAIALGLMFSPPLANLAELLLILVIVATPTLRTRLLQACHRPLVLAVLGFGVWIALGVSYSIAPLEQALSMLAGWRKLLLLPLALALFDEPCWKRRFILVMVSFAGLVCLVSFTHWFAGFAVIDDEPGVLIRNHAFQGSVFAVSAFGACILAFEERQGRAWLIGLSLLFVANILLVTPGRSGYLVLLICALALSSNSHFLPRAGWRARAAFAFIVLAVLLSALALAPTSRLRILQAVQETEQYEQARETTSMGIRMVFWKNTLDLIRDRPLVGYGTGSFASAYAARVKEKSGIAGTLSGDPHNQYMKILAEHGLLGLALFLLFLLAALREPVAQPWRLLGLGVMIAWCATSLANSHFSTFSEGTFIYLWLGVMLAGGGVISATRDIRSVDVTAVDRQSG